MNLNYFLYYSYIYLILAIKIMAKNKKNNLEIKNKKFLLINKQ